MANNIAPVGTVYVCAACGKTSKTAYGFLSDGTPRGADRMPDGSRVADPGWDESCMLHAILCKADGPPWIAITEPVTEM